MAIRVLIAEDSPTIREHLARIVESDPRFEIVGVAADGYEAIELAERLSPDVITMDIRMPRLDGVEATARIMASNPCPIVVISASTDSAETRTGFRALAAGALEILEKPRGLTAAGYEAVRRQITDTLALMAEVKVVRRWAGASGPSGPVQATAVRSLGRATAIRALAICSSTGGPPALHSVLKGLDPAIDVAVFIVQHMATGFTEGLVHWLANGSSIPIEIAADGIVARPGHAYVAPDDRHLLIHEGGVMALSDALPVRHHRPSGDWLFRSVATCYGSSAVGIVLTGMGCDGSDGVRVIHQSGGHVIAQDEESSVIFSMPKAVIDAGIASEVLPLRAIPERLNELVRSRRPRTAGRPE